ncbi:MAG TPA: PDZ domain-containing protein, partial [Planctomycetota bacterium]|nr:PDZ domain-containing protein [Planctomycetota bacterium]
GTHAWTLGGGSIALPGAASSVALRGEWAVTGGDEGEVRVWNLASGTEGVRLKGHAGVVSAVLIHPGGARVITGGVDHAIQVWDLRTGDKVRSLLGHKGAVRALALLPGARRVASAGMDGVRVWDLASGQPIHAMEMNGISACAVAAGLGTESIVVTGGDNRVWVWGTPRGPREEPPADTRPGGFLGVSYVDGGGALVQGVFKDSAAERAGFRVGDVIVGVDDVPVDRSEDFLNYMRRSHEGDDVHVRVQRGGESRVIRVKFGRWKDQ